MADISYLQNDDLEEADEGMEDEDDEEIGDNLQGDSGGDGGGGGGDEGGGDLLSPMARLQQHASSETSYNRQMVGRIMVEIFRAALRYRTEIHVQELMRTLEYMADDIESSVRSELAEQVPHIAMVAEQAPLFFGDVLGRYLFPIMLKLLRDNDNQVRQTAQAALLVLIERDLLPKYTIESVVCPFVLEMSYSPGDFLTSAIALMSKMAPLLGSELTEAVFLERYIALCSDKIFFVRKVCALNISNFCAAVSKETVENILLPRFIELCDDEVWGVRKTCAEVIMSVSCCVSMYHRQNILAPHFAAFLGDDSRWVRASAFQILGPFISTFAQQFTGLNYNRYGELVFTNEQGIELRYNIIAYSGYSEMFFGKASSHTNLQPYSEEEDEPKENPRQTVIIQSKLSQQQQTSEPATSEVENENEEPDDRRAFVPHKFRWPTENDGDDDVKAKSDVSDSRDIDKFNPFLYYYIPPEPLDLELVGTKEESEEQKESTEKETKSEVETETETGSETGAETKNVKGTSETWGTFRLCLESEAGKQRMSPSSSDELTITAEETTESAVESKSESTAENTGESESGPSSLQNTSELLNDTADVSNVSSEKATAETPPKVENRPSESDETSQNIVPQVLIDYFVSMSDPTQTVGPEIPHHCAYSFPAVTLTLGRKNWPLLRGAYQALATALQWKVRCTLASSIHELAMILGEDLTARDLVPIYDGFIKDLDEVRIGTLKHLATFLKVLRPAERCQYLPRLSNFLVTDNEWNWRFRKELASQLLEAVALFSPLDVSKHIAPVSLHLLVDKIAAVRTVALSLVTQIISHLSTDDALMIALVRELSDMLVTNSERWARRQTYALLCSHLISSGAITGERFAKEMLPYLMNLSKDKVANVRLAVARTLARNVATMSPEWLGAEHADAVEQKLRQMQQDADRDVREFATVVDSRQ